MSVGTLVFMDVNLEWSVREKAAITTRSYSIGDLSNSDQQCNQAALKNDGVAEQNKGRLN